MKTLSYLAASIALASCNTTTTTTTQRLDGKTVTVVVQRQTNDGVITTITNALLGGFLTVFQSPK